MNSYAHYAEGSPPVREIELVYTPFPMSISEYPFGEIRLLPAWRFRRDKGDILIEAATTRVLGGYTWDYE